jgi:hypothetical protein
MSAQYRDIEFHSQRALAELDLARSAASAVAAEAHLRLSRLHTEKLRTLGPALVPAAAAMQTADL